MSTTLVPIGSRAPASRGRRAAVATAMACLVLTACAGGAREERLAARSEALSPAGLVGTSLPPKTLALTFDDGPGDRTVELSMYLKAQGIAATFFVNGGRLATTTLPNPNGLTPVANAQAVLAQLVADGHLVANHTVTHRDLVTQVLGAGAAQLTQELAETDALIAPHVPSRHLLFRPPYGSYDDAVYASLAATAMNKYVGPVMWDLGGSQASYPSAAADWACWQGQLRTTGGALANGTGYATTAQCGDAYLNEIGALGRGIVLLHDPYGWAQGSTVDMVKYLVPLLKAQGYAFVRADAVPSIAALLPCHASCVTCSGPDANQCTSCDAAHYLAAGTCLPCASCLANQYTVAACASGANTVCGACHASCATCDGAAATNCVSCGAGRFLSAGACAACAVCPKGMRQRAACTAIADAACEPCPAGTFAASEGALACASCGSCDDDDACTSDRCDAARGCVHDRVAGCAHDGGPDGDGSPDGDGDGGGDRERDASDERDGEGDTALQPLPASDGASCTVVRAPRSSGPSLASFALTLAATLALRRRDRCRAAREVS